MLYRYVFNEFRQNVALKDDEIFINGSWMSLAHPDANARLDDPTEVVMDFYTKDRQHIGFIDGAFWSVREAFLAKPKEELVEKSKSAFQSLCDKLKVADRWMKNTPAAPTNLDDLESRLLKAKVIGQDTSTPSKIRNKP